jgi:ABC-2 type transport system permease protein
MPMRGLWNLTWLEIKIFVREPLGVFGAVVVPVLLFIVLGRMLGSRARAGAPDLSGAVAVDVPVLAAILIALSAVLSLVTVISIYREGGILKRLRATPLRPATILTAHVLVKLVFTALTLGLMALAGRRFYPVNLDAPWGAFAIALLVSTTSILSLGFLIASLVPTARFAQPIGTLLLYPMVAVSGLFIPVESLPPALHAAARLMPVTYAVALMKGVLLGDPWSAHLWDLAVLVAFFGAFTLVSSRVFRWE